VTTRRARRIEDVLLLVLLCGALLSLVAGLTLARTISRPLLVLDTSPSMSAAAGDRTRILRAREELMDWLDGHPDAPPVCS
jgi:hypothetical protein